MARSEHLDVFCVRGMLGFLCEITKTNNNDKILDKVILIIINSSAPVSVTVCKELLMKLLNKCSDAPTQSVPDKAAHMPHSYAKIPDNNMYPVPIKTAIAIFMEPSSRGFMTLVMCHIPKSRACIIFVVF